MYKLFFNWFFHFIYCEYFSMPLHVFLYNLLTRYMKFHWIDVLWFFKRFYLFIFSNRGREGEREGEKRVQDWSVSFYTPLTRDLVRKPGICSDWGSNLWHFSLQTGTQSPEPHQLGLSWFINWSLIVAHFNCFLIFCYYKLWWTSK